MWLEPILPDSESDLIRCSCKLKLKAIVNWNLPFLALRLCINQPCDFHNQKNQAPDYYQ